jgi:hypothetical protein
MKNKSSALDPAGFLFVIIFIVMGIGFGYSMFCHDNLQNTQSLEKYNE